MIDITKRIKMDCFANPQLKDLGGMQTITCDALSGWMEHKLKPLDCTNCSFYRTKKKNDLLLMRFNGTTDIEEILREYADDRGSYRR